MEIKIENLSHKQKQDVIPTKATLQIETDLGTDTVKINAKWAAMFMKRLRQGGVNVISLNGCLPPKSLEHSPTFRHVTKNYGDISDHKWRGWLEGKAVNEDKI